MPNPTFPRSPSDVRTVPAEGPGVRALADSDAPVELVHVPPAPPLIVHPLADDPFVPRAPWIGGHLQTIRNTIVSTAGVGPFQRPGERVLLDLADGTGDQLAVMVHLPDDAAAERARVHFDGAAPIAVLVHGLAGSEDSLYVRQTARTLLDEGLAVVRLNLRGCGASAPYCHFDYHGGRTEDLAAALHALAAVPGLDAPDRGRGGFILVGYSLGANLSLKLGAECGPADRLRGVVAISTPLDLAACSLRIRQPRQMPYHTAMLRGLKRAALRDGAYAQSHYADVVMAASSMRDFDDVYVAVVNGFDSAEHYYASSSALFALPHERVPALVVHALDDPVVDPTAYVEFDWASHPLLTSAIAPSGGHVGFHVDGGGTWHDRRILDWLGLSAGRPWHTAAD